jgi:DNA gyrase inhibitor GyrI
MRVVTFVLALPVVIVACGGGEAPPEQPTLPPQIMSAPALDTLESFNVAYLRWVGTYDSLGVKFDEVAMLAKDAGVEKCDLVGLYCNSPEVVQPESLISDVCVVVPETVEIPGLETKTIDGGVYVTMTVLGPYESVADYYGYLFAFIGEKRYTICGPFVEYYPGMPEGTPPESLKSETRVPVMIGD